MPIAPFKFRDRLARLDYNPLNPDFPGRPMSSHRDHRFLLTGDFLPDGEMFVADDRPVAIHAHVRFEHTTATTARPFRASCTPAMSVLDNDGVSASLSINGSMLAAVRIVRRHSPTYRPHLGNVPIKKNLTGA